MARIMFARIGPKPAIYLPARKLIEQRILHVMLAEPSQPCSNHRPLYHRLLATSVQAWLDTSCYAVVIVLVNGNEAARTVFFPRPALQDGFAGRIMSCSSRTALSARTPTAGPRRSVQAMLYIIRKVI